VNKRPAWEGEAPAEPMGKATRQKPRPPRLSRGSLGNRRFPPAKSLLLSQKTLSRPCKKIMRLCHLVPFDDTALSSIGTDWQQMSSNGTIVQLNRSQRG